MRNYNAVLTETDGNLYMQFHWFEHIEPFSLARYFVEWLAASYDWISIYPSIHIKLPNESLQWRYYERDGVSNQRGLHCLLNCWFRCRSKKTSKLRVTAVHHACMQSSDQDMVTCWRWPIHKYHDCEKVIYGDRPLEGCSCKYFAVCVAVYVGITEIYQK